MGNEQRGFSVDGTGELESYRIENELRNMVIRAELPLGSYISQAALIDKLNCGRTPLREAINRLSATGELVSIPNKGITVPPLDFFKLTSALEMLDAVYPIAIRLATERITDERIEELRVLLEMYRTAIEKDSGNEARIMDIEFHKKTMEATGNAFFVSAVENANTYLIKSAYTIKREKNIFLRTITKDIDILKEHSDIFYALKNHDSDMGEKAAKLHFQKERANVFALFYNS